MVALMVFLASVITTLFVLTLDNERLTAISTIGTIIVLLLGAITTLI